jgi:hypothetical protein
MQAAFECHNPVSCQAFSVTEARTQILGAYPAPYFPSSNHRNSEILRLSKSALDIFEINTSFVTFTT